MVERSTLEPVNACPKCKGKQPRQDQDGLERAYERLADAGHEEARGRLNVIRRGTGRTTVGTSLKSSRFTEAEQGSMQTDMIKMINEGKSKDEIRRAMLKTFVKPKNPEYKSCKKCGKAGTLKCGACRTARYCGAACQKADWKKHKKECKEDEEKGEAFGKFVEHSRKVNKLAPKGSVLNP